MHARVSSCVGSCVRSCERSCMCANLHTVSVLQTQTSPKANGAVHTRAWHSGTAQRHGTAMTATAAWPWAFARYTEARHALLCAPKAPFAAWRVRDRACSTWRLERDEAVWPSVNADGRADRMSGEAIESTIHRATSCQGPPRSTTPDGCANGGTERDAPSGAMQLSTSGQDHCPSGQDSTGSDGDVHGSVTIAWSVRCGRSAFAARAMSNGSVVLREAALVSFSTSPTGANELLRWFMQVYTEITPKHALPHRPGPEI